MTADEVFLDTNVLVYLLSEDKAKADRAEAILAAGGTISVQVLNEFVSVGMRKAQLSVPEIRNCLAVVRAVCTVHPLDLETHEFGLDITERYGLSFYDSLILAAARQAGCSVVYSEDMQDGQVVDGVTIRNPFQSG